MRIARHGVSPKAPLDPECADWRGLRVPCAGDSAAALFAKYIHADYNHALRLSVPTPGWLEMVEKDL